MAEAVGLTASIIQIVSLAVKCSEALNQFSTSLSHERKNVQELRTYVDSNSRVLSRFAALLERNVVLKAELRQDIELAVEGCRNVFDEILEVHDSASTPRSGVARILQKTRYAAFDEARVDRLRARLSQNQITLNLMLFIHWRVPEVEQSTQALANLLRASVNEALHSSVPSIAQAVRDCVDQISGLSLQGKLDGSTLNDASTTSELERQSSDSSSSSSKAQTVFSTSRSASQASQASKSPGFRQPPVPLLPQLSTLSQQPPAEPLTRGLASRSTSLSSSSAPTTASLPRSATQASDASRSTALTQPSLPPLSQLWTSNLPEADSAKQAVRTMWLALVTSPGNIIFEQQPISAAQIDQFALDKAAKLMAGLSKLDPAARSSLNAHVSKLQEKLIAIQVHRQSFLTRQMRSMDVVTERVAASDSSPRNMPCPHPNVGNLGKVDTESACAHCRQRHIQCDGQDPRCEKNRRPTWPAEGLSAGALPSGSIDTTITSTDMAFDLQPAIVQPFLLAHSDAPASGSQASPPPPAPLEAPRNRPRCYEHGCNGREFTTFSNLLRHQREKSGVSTRSYCPDCRAEFTRSTALSNHRKRGCKPGTNQQQWQQALTPSPHSSLGSPSGYSAPSSNSQSDATPSNSMREPTVESVEDAFERSPKSLFPSKTIQSTEQYSSSPASPAMSATDSAMGKLDELDFALLAQELDRTLRMRWEEPSQSPSGQS